MGASCQAYSRRYISYPDGFWDILEERRRTSDLSHALRTFNPQPYKGAPPCSSSELNRAVLESQFLRHVVKEVSAESGEPVEVVRDEASGLLEEMSQNLQLTFIRLLGFSLSKVFKRLFQKILINEEGLNRLQQAIPEHPVILMPNHRSYIDFLVLSYIMFTYDLPIPVIAAGIPLMSMKLIGEIFRRSGAFFIRRAIGDDKLYWALLSEYVRTIVRIGFAPVEFFVEGLRSRTLKSLPPKLGMMHMVLEPFLKGEVYDISLVPISISYDRVLEESLLAHELLGVPKPKETTRGLLKARKILEDDYGSMHVCFGEPLSVRGLAKGTVNRWQYNLVPRDLPAKPSEETLGFVSGVAHLVVRLQEKGMVLSPWSLIATVLLQNPLGMDLDALIQRTCWLRELVEGFGAVLHWTGRSCEVVLSSLSRHHSVVRCEKGRVTLVEEAGASPATPEEGVFRRAAAVLMCASYRNQALHVFVRPALVATAITSPTDIFAHFQFLQDVFSNEFIFIPGTSHQDFEEGCSSLRKCGAVQVCDQQIRVTEEGKDTIFFLTAVLEPFIQTYQMVFRHLTNEPDQPFTERQYITGVRSSTLKRILSGKRRYPSFEALSSDVQKNVLSGLVRMGGVTKLKKGVRSEFRVDKTTIGRIADKLGKIYILC
uniref:Phospholipid/glycerol acyltransferase domain-containing protein n=1 Tax=Denticeps clupeoides TaxID=299321 RepID=A0AAY4CZW9_9TELE